MTSGPNKRIDPAWTAASLRLCCNLCPLTACRNNNNNYRATAGPRGSDVNCTSDDFYHSIIPRMRTMTRERCDWVRFSRKPSLALVLIFRARRSGGKYRIFGIPIVRSRGVYNRVLGKYSQRRGDIETRVLGIDVEDLHQLCPQSSPEDKSLVAEPLGVLLHPTRNVYLARLLRGKLVDFEICLKSVQP